MPTPRNNPGQEHSLKGFCSPGRGDARPKFLNIAKIQEINADHWRGSKA